MTIEETREERHRIVAKALSQPPEKESLPKPPPAPDTVIETEKPKKKTASKAKENKPAKKE